MRKVLPVLLTIFVLGVLTADANARNGRRGNYRTTYYSSDYYTPYTYSAGTAYYSSPSTVYYDRGYYSPDTAYYDRSYYSPGTVYYDRGYMPRSSYYSPYYYPSSGVDLYGPRGGGIRIR